MKNHYIFRLFLLLLPLLTGQFSQAQTTFTVTNTNNTGSGSLRQAMDNVMALASPGPFTITATASGTINLAAVLPDITKDITFIGPGASNLTVRRNSGGNYRIFNIPNNNTVSFNGFTIADGFADQDNGGGIQNEGILTLTNCVVRNNRATFDAGGVRNRSSLTVNNCFFEGNSTGTFGAGLYHLGSSLSVINSTFRSNTTNQGGGGIGIDGSNATITSCLFTGNTAGGGGGMLARENALITNCTFSGNIGNGIRSDGNSLTVVNSTVTGNRSGDGAILINDNATLRLLNCIVAGNTDAGGTTALNIITAGGGTVMAASSFNLIGTGGSGGLTNGANNNIVGVDALLAPLGNYGGPTQTHALLPGSPAINAGTNSGDPTTDQRGFARVGATDIGSFESRGFTLALTGGSSQSAMVGTAFTNPLRVTVSSANSEPVNGGVVTYTGPGSGASINPASVTASIASGVAGASVMANTTAGGPYNVAATASGASPTINFSLTNTPAASTITGFAAVDNTVCVGSPITFTATVGNVSGSYNFTVTNGSNTTMGSASGSGFSQSLTAAGNGSQAFTLTVNDNGQSASANTNVTINALPTAMLVSSGTLTCSQTSVSLMASGGNSYMLINPSGVVILTANGFAVSTNVSSPGSYSVRVGDVNGCVSTTSTSVISNIATITTSNPATNTVNINAPFSQTFTAMGGVSPYSFSLSSGSLPTGLSLSSSGVLSGTPTQGGSFTVVVRGRDANGCFDLGPNYVLTVNATPTIAGFSTLDNTVCAGSPNTFTATVGNVNPPYAFTLSNGTIGTPTGTTMGNASSTAFSQVLTAAGNGPQSFTLTVSDGGPSATATTNVTVTAAPSATIAYSGSPFMTSNSPVSVSQTGTAGGTYSSSPAGLSLNAGTGQITPAISSPGSYIVTYAIAVSGGCAPFSITAPVGIQQPQADLSITNTDGVSTVVPGGAVTYTITVRNTGPQAVTGARVLDTFPATLTPTWTAVGAGGGMVTAAGSGNIDELVNLPVGGSVTFTVSANISAGATGTLSNTATVTAPAGVTDPNPGNNSATDTDTITPASPTVTGLAASPSAVCVGSPITFTATVGNVSGSYNFTLTNGTATTTGAGSTTAFNQVVTASGNGSQSFTLTVSASGQTNTATTSLTVNALPVAGLTNNGPLSCTQTSVTLTASGGTSYTFTSLGGGVLGTSGATRTRTVTTSGVYSVSVSDANGCVSATNTTVTSTTAMVTVTNPTVNMVNINQTFSQMFTASGGATPHSFSLTTGTLPTGLSLAASGVLSGTPTQTGQFTITVRATDANGCVGTGAAYVLTVNTPPALGALSASPSTVCEGSLVTFTAAISNGANGYSFTLTNGTNPLTGNSNQATFSQNVLATGSGGSGLPGQTYTLTVSNGGATTTATTNLTVNPLPVVSLTFPDGTTVIGPNTGTATVIVSSFENLFMQVGTGSAYDFVQILDRINGYEIRRADSNSNGRFQISQIGPYRVTVTNGNGCKRTVAGVVQTR